MGLTNGNVNAGLAFKHYAGGFHCNRTSLYGKSVTSTSQGDFDNSIVGALGITPDPTKSGLITKFAGLTLGTVTSEKLGNFYIRY